MAMTATIMSVARYTPIITREERIARERERE